MRPAHVMVLERHRELREAFVEALLYEGYLVTPAPSAAAAQLALRTASPGQLPQVVVLDAEDDGELLAELRADARFAGIGVVNVSFGLGSVVPADVDVRRPFRLADLLAAVRCALEGRERSPGAAPEHHAGP